jgi:membrane protease YdiL (CAAX protease family)
MMNRKDFHGVDARIWLTFVFAAAISAVLILPYALEFSGQSIPALPQFLEISLLAFIQSALLFALIVYLGLRISRKIGIEPTPVLSGKVKLRESLSLSVISGIVAGLAIVVLDLFLNAMFVFPLKEGLLPGAGNPGAIEGFLASFYGGTSEELLLRLFFVPFICLVIIGILKLLGRAKTWEHTDNIVWISVVIAAILFGLGHLPATSLIMAITPAVILRAVLLNGVGGLVFGWLFYRKGLESAMISHFSTDIVLHVLLPLLNVSLL